MGILNRVFNITKSRLNNFTNNYSLDETDDELKKIIEELNSNEYNFDKPNKKVVSTIPEDILKAYSIIGANPEDTKEEIKSKFKAAIKKNHPDMFSNINDAERKQIEENTIAILNAYKLILNYLEHK